MARPSPSIQPIGSMWTNWSGSEPFGPPVSYRPKDIAELVAVAKQAGPGARVKASGSRWSASSAARADHVWVDTSALNRVIAWDLRQLANEARSPTKVENLVLVQAGAKIHELATASWGRGMSIPTLGGSMGQSLAGAISTGTHGSDLDMPPISGMVRAIHLVGPDGQEYWLEHPDRPIASHGALERHYADWHSSMRLRRLEQHFNTALVSVGRCGFIYAYVLELEPAYQLHTKRVGTNWPLVRLHLQQAALSGNWLGYMRSRPPLANPSVSLANFDVRTVRGLEVVLNPDSHAGQAWWTGRWKLPVHVPRTPVVPEQKYAQQRHVVQSLATALSPGAGGSAGGAVGFLAGLGIGGPLGAIIGGIIGAIGGGVAADSEDVFRVLTDLVFPDRLGPASAIGPSYEISSGTAFGWSGYAQKYAEFWRDAPKGQFTEIFFDAESSGYLNFIDNMLNYFRMPGSGKQAGYIALRFMGRSAPLAMQRWRVTVAVEVVLLEAMDPRAKQTLQHVNLLALQHHPRYHWGMIRPDNAPYLQARHEVEQWKSGAAKLGVTLDDGFGSSFSRKAGLEPDKRRNSAFLLTAGGAMGG